MTKWDVHVDLLSTWLWAIGPPTTVRYVHNGAVLPYARVVVVVVPLTILTGFWWLVKHRGR